MNWKLPNLLTLSRIAVIPVLVFLFYVQTPFTDRLIALLFILACLTDFFDGYFARYLHQTTPIGTYLDPVADKLLITTTLFMLAGTSRIQGLALIPAVIILSRELLVSSLRVHLSVYNISIPVSAIAKWKTFIQMSALICLLVGHGGYISVWGLDMEDTGIILLWGAGILTLFTGFFYMKETLKPILEDRIESP